MRVLLTGGAGYIGSHAAVALVEAGHEPVLLDNLSNSSFEVVERIEKIVRKKITFIDADVRDVKSVLKVLIDHRVDSVMHFAGLKAVAESMINPVEYYSVNVQGTISLLTAMKLASVKTLIFSSSATVYGEPEYLPYDEDHPTKAINVYGRTKLHVEEILNDVYVSDPEWSIVCLRYFNPVGAHGSGSIGEDPKGIPSNLMPYLSRVASGSLPQLNIFGGDYETADGTGVRDFIHVLDLVDGHLSALLYCHRNHRYDVINLGSGKGVSVLEMLKSFECATGLSIPHEIVSRRVGDLPIYYASAEKAKALLKWQSKRGPADMCLSAWKFQSREKC